MRGSIARCFAALLCSACASPPSELESTPEHLPLVSPLDSRPEAPTGSGAVRFVGPNPGCPTLRVFKDAEELCERGILPLQPVGECRRLPLTNAATDEDGWGPETSADPVRIDALDGEAELFVKHYIGSGDSGNETVYLALRGVNGYVLLATVADYSSQGNDVPKFERFVGNDVGVEVHTLQEWWNLDDDPVEISELRRHTVRCTLDEDGAIRCDGECPTLAVVEAVSALDCAALAKFDWSQLSRGRERDLNEDWGGRWDEYALASTQDYLGIEERDGLGPPERLREVEVENRTLAIIEAKPGRWALLHGLVPLVASEGEIRVGPGPGGIFVSSESAGERRIHRLHIATHELEPVLPGPCS